MNFNLNSIQENPSEFTPQVAPNNFKEFKLILENSTDEELINYYNTIRNESTTILDISQKYQIIKLLTSLQN